MSALGAALEAESDLIADALFVFAGEAEKGLKWRRVHNMPMDTVDDSMRNRRSRALALNAAIRRAKT